MRAFTTLCIAITLALSANANILSKRINSDPVAQCLLKFDDLKEDLGNLSPLVNIFEEIRDGEKADINLQIKQNQERIVTESTFVIEDFRGAFSKCCGDTIKSVTEDEGKAIFGALEDYAKVAANVSNVFSSKVDAFDKQKQSYIDAQKFISNLTSPSKSFHDCLVQKVPAAYTENAKHSLGGLDYAYEDAAKAFNVQVSGGSNM